MEFVILEHTKELLSVLPARQVPSQFNFLRHSIGQVEELGAPIAGSGLLHILVVTKQAAARGNSRELTFAVAAGERLRHAMLRLR